MNLLPSLNHLSTYPDIHLSICVIQVLSNMAHNSLLKANFVHFGILDSVIGKQLSDTEADWLEQLGHGCRLVRASGSWHTIG